ncbi:TonB-dependent receptor domain-containing protein [Planctobacterium marinum]|uniref:TonB-dependent receptor domain-containing protein n=1 Tax=Planctobacterium marinum TaxID=1631968 RepID=UPI001E2F4A9B|nr:TonB-dependent receptor [Planctobacterium marinum]MCC2603953.1 TonB-dependent receptor [Planctobacterium marinum]
MNKTLHMLLGLTCALTPVAAAIAQETTTNEEKAVERIQVTGSNIRGVDLEGTQPLQIISAEDIAQSGANSVFELLQNLGQTRGGSGTFSTTESGSTSNSTPAGQAAASLRGLGPSSTLTLINGRRVAPSSFAAGTENFVDVNSIPLAAIESIEVLATGASAIYGADAVAGVINYILKKDYQGAELNVSFEDSVQSSDESKKSVNIVWGGAVAGGNLTLFADLYDKNAFEASDRPISAEPLLVNSYSYLPKLPYPNIYYFSSRDGNELPNPDCPYPTTVTEFGEDICAYYSNGDSLLDSELESQSVGAIYSRDIGDVQWNTDFFFSRSESVAISTPAPINDEFDGEGPFAPYSALDIYSEADLQAWQGVSSPYDIIWDDPFTTQAGQDLYGFRYDARFQDPRTIENETQSFRLVSSLAGEIGDWQWETAVTYSESESEQEAISGIYNRYKYNAAVHGELCADGSIADYDGDSDTLNCGSAGLLGAFNPFIINDANNDAILAVAQERPTRNGKSSVFGIDARFNGELMEFGDDYIRAAFGVEYRQEDLEDIPSANSRANFDNEYLVDVFGFGSSLARADRTQYGAFAELYIPLHETVDMQLAGRYDHYDDFGSTFNPKVGISWRPTDQLIIRGSFASSFRAPSLTQAGIELRTTTSTFDCAANAQVSDLYCSGDGREVTENTLELGSRSLRAEESDSVSIGFAWSPADDTTITADYWSFEHKNIVDTNMTGVLAEAVTDDSLRHCGLVPTGSTGISYGDEVCIDTYADAIRGDDGNKYLVNAQGTVITDVNGDYLPGYSDDDLHYVQVLGPDGLLVDQTNDLFGLLDRYVLLAEPRDPELPFNRDHVIPLENTGTQDVSGLDVKIAHDMALWDGVLSLDLDWTHYLSFDRNKPGSDEIEELIGTYRYPENIANLSMVWGNDDYYGGVTLRYVDGYEDDIEGMRGREIDELVAMGVLPDADSSRNVSSWTTVDARFGIILKNATIKLNIDNLFDRDPPVVYGSSRGFDTINHNAYGTTYRISYTHFF